MVKISIGRVGQDESDFSSFSLEDIKNGAVRDSDLFPEIYASPWPVATSGVLVTGVERKIQEHSMTMGSAFPLFMPPSLLPEALEDSNEKEKTAALIALGKLYKGFLGPVFTHASSLHPSPQQAFYNRLAHRAQVKNLGHVMAISDDRGLRMDPQFRDILYGDLRDHYSQQVREVFEQKNVPGKRVKEADGAHLGVINALSLYQRAEQEMTAKGVKFDPYQYMDTTLCLRPVLTGHLPWPDEGLIIKAEGAARRLRPITSADIIAFDKGRIFSYDHFDMPVYDGLPPGTTIHDLKRRLANDASPTEQKALSHIDPNVARRYMTEVHSPGAAAMAFKHISGLDNIDPAISEKARPRKLANKKPTTIWTSAHVLTGRRNEGRIQKILPVPNNMRLTEMNGELTDSLRVLEEVAHSGQVPVIMDPSHFTIKNAKKKTPKELADIRLLQNLQTSLIFVYSITMSTMAGATAHIGHPHMVDQDWYRKFGKWHPTLCNMGLTGDQEREAYYLYDSDDEFRKGLEDHYDATTYQHAAPLPPDDFQTRAELLQTLGIDDPGFTISNYGSASGYADETYKHPYQSVLQQSKWDNTTQVHGGGVRSSMLAMVMAGLQAIEEGHSVRNVGIRSESDVSPLEGNIKDFIRSIDHTPVTDPNNSEHLTYADGQMHILNLHRILPRQAGIGALSHVANVFDGGKGSVLEFFLTATNNAQVRILGKGLFGHSEITPVLVHNREIDIMGRKHGIFDSVLEPYANDLDMMGVVPFSGENPVPEALDWTRQYAEGRILMPGQVERLNFHLEEQNPTRTTVVMSGNPAIAVLD